MKAEFLQAVETQVEWLRWAQSQDAALQNAILQVRDLAWAHYLRNLSQGELHYVGPEFCDLLEKTVVGMPDVTFSVDLFPCPVGFVLFARPITLEALTIKPSVPMQMNGIGWNRALDRETVQHMVRQDERHGLRAPTIRDTLQVMTYTAWMSDKLREPFYPGSYFAIHDGDSVKERIDEYEETAAGHQPPRLGEFTDQVDENGQYVKRERHEIRYLMALLLLLNQRILVRQKFSDIPRATRRRAERAGRESFDNYQVITLRRYMSPSAETEEHHDVNWTCRWIVSGHWRQQFYPSQGVHRPVWILPHVKGPENMPMKDSKKVMVVVR